MSSKRLLVEGNNDRAFYQAFCKKLGLSDVKVEVITPKDIGAHRDGWSNLIDYLPTELKRLSSGNIDQLAIILDADFLADNQGGLISRRSLVTTKINDYLTTKSIAPYQINSEPNYQNGDVFSHPNGLPDIGLWITPDHKNEGMIENLVETMISNNQEQQQIFNYVNQSIDQLPIQLFKNIHLSKAKVNTWRAWQKEPGLRLPDALNQNLLDINSQIATNFSNWLLAVFKN
jgi:hypothetical protein